MPKSFYARTLLAIVVIKAVFLLFFVHQELIGLGPDEAQYWTWSRHLSLGYYSKPPGIAWQIFLGTLFFGDSELGVRVVSVFLGSLIPTAVFWLGKKSNLSERAAFLGALAFTLSPLGFFSSFLAITDVGAVFFFTLAFIILMEGWVKENINYRQAGIFVALGGLFKWISYYFWFFAFAALLLKKGKPKDFFLGMLISLAGLVPSMIWNIQNGFVTFLHVYYQAQSKGDLAPNPQILSWKSFFDFFGSQAALVSPLLFIMLLIALVFYKKAEKAPRFLALSTAVSLVVFALLSFFMKIQGNWCDFIYPIAFCYLGWYWDSQRKWVYAGSLLSLAATLYLFFTPLLENTPFALPFRQNPFKHNLGWHHLGDALKMGGYQADKHFLFAPKYQTVSLLTFYGPGQKKAYFFNIFGARLNQFSFWPGMSAEQKGHDGYFVIIENAPHIEKEREKIPQTLGALKPYFKNVTFAGSFPLYESQGKTVKAAFLFFGEDFTGEEPLPPKKY